MSLQNQHETMEPSSRTVSRTRASGAGPRAGLKILSVCIAVAVAATACLEIEYTDDGVPIVPFNAGESPSALHRVGGVELKIEFEAWTNRMPGPATVPGSGFPLGVSVRFSPEGTGHEVDSILVPALSLWSADGDSLLAALPLVDLDGGEPWVRLGSDAAPTELTAARLPIRALAGSPDAPCAPRLLVKSPRRTLVLALPEAPVKAAY